MLSASRATLRYRRAASCSLSNAAPWHRLPPKQALYDPARERDSCGVGIVCHMQGEASRAIVEDALLVLARMTHRGGAGCDPLSGDGAGILLGMPDAFMRRIARDELGHDLPARGRYAVGNMFFGHDMLQNSATKGIFHKIAALHGFDVLGWREVPTDLSAIGQVARDSAPRIEQVFMVPSPHGRLAETLTQADTASDGSPGAELRGATDLARELFRVRKVITNEVRSADHDFYVASLDSNTIVYKGLLTARQIPAFYQDLQQPDLQSHLGMVHSRFSTNTFPSWDRAQPNRLSCHNGEINTCNGNMNWMRARAGVMRSPYFGDSTSQLLPIVSDGMSDSGNLDSVLELLVKASDNRSLPEAMAMLLPESQTWHEPVVGAGQERGGSSSFDEPTVVSNQPQRDMSEFMACQMEPWDGPAMVGFTDGVIVGATLDRNGLRPMRWCVTEDDRLIMGSEAGTVLGIHDSDVVEKGKLQPGRMMLLDTSQGRVVPNTELKQNMAALRPYGEMLNDASLQMSEWVQAARSNTAGHRLGGKARPKDSPAVPKMEFRAKPGTTFWMGRYAGEGGAYDAGSVKQMEQVKAQRTRRMLLQHGYTAEDMSMMLGPLANAAKDPMGSMGNDAPLAVLSRQPRPVFDYFKQLFAQVTNPPIDPIRERLVMSLRCPIGPEGNLLAAGKEECSRLIVPNPVLTEEELMVIRDTSYGPWHAAVLDTTFDLEESSAAKFKEVVEGLCLEASSLARSGAPIIVLSDRAAGEGRVSVPSLLAASAIHQHLVKTQQRTSCAIVVDCADARDVHHMCCLLSFGADAVCPYLAYDALTLMNADGLVRAAAGVDNGKPSDETLFENYRKGVGNGILKVMSKMGISTVQSYKGAQVFEVIGLDDDVVNTCFPGTDSRVAGAGFEVIFADQVRLHEQAWPGSAANAMATQTLADAAPPLLPQGGQYHYRSQAESHLNAPDAMASLRSAVRTQVSDGGSPEQYAEYTRIVDGINKQTTLRGVLKFREDAPGVVPISIEEVEPVSEIVKRFNTGAMSLGSISQETHETLAVAMNRLGGRSNTGEGGEDVTRFDDERRSAIKQVASGRFGVTSNYLANADQIQIKVAQGAKPGEGGELPGYKVSAYIGETRRTVPGVGLISPPPHHDIYSIEDLAQLIHDLKRANPRAEVSVKLVSSAGVGVVAAGVAKAKADHITISGHDGGTGAAAWTGIKHCGMPWELGIAEAQQTLVLNGLRGRVRLQADGQMKTGRDVVIAALLGAEEIGFATAPLITLGCIMMRKCHLNTCPVGVATQDPVLRAKFSGQPEHVMNFFWLMAEEIRGYMAALGVRRFDDLIGRAGELLEMDHQALHYKSRGLDLSKMLTPASELEGGVLPAGSPQIETRKVQEQDHGLDSPSLLDLIMIEQVNLPFLEPGRTAGGGAALLPPPESTRMRLGVENVNRTVGAMLSYEVTRRYGEAGLPNDTIVVELQGSAGQSLGFALAPGITLDVTGEANDYVGKSLSGGRIILRPRGNGTDEFRSEEHVIVGNTCLYGAVTGDVFVGGRAGERFAVRNSGARAVVEGVGDHGCEYMTGGRVVVLGRVGRNFAAGMSGGLSFVLDTDDHFSHSCNTETVAVESCAGLRDGGEVWVDTALEELHQMVQHHADETGSSVAQELLADWEGALRQFVCVVPHEYRAVLNRGGEGEEVEEEAA